MQCAGSKSLHFLRLDITDETSVKHFAASLEAEFGGVTILVNNAGESAYLLFCKAEYLSNQIQQLVILYAYNFMQL